MVAAAGPAARLIPVRPRWIIGLTAAVLALAGGVAAWTGEVPCWTSGGTRMVLPTVLSAAPKTEIALPSRGIILFVGDSNTAGSRVGGSRYAYPSVFRDALSAGLEVKVQAFGGATTADLLARPLPEGPVDLAFVMLGTNDAAPRGWMSSKHPLSLSTYRANLTELISRLSQKHARIVVLAPPPLGSSAMARRLDPYRVAAREVARETASQFRDTAAAFEPKPAADFLQRDAVHLTQEAQRELGLWLLAQTMRNSSAEKI